MFYRIDEISTHKDTGLTYVLVRFWESKASHDAGSPALLKNDFFMQLRDEASRIVTNEVGWFKRASDGAFVDPAKIEPLDTTEWERETVKVDVPAVLRSNIEAFMDRATARSDTGDKTDKRATRDQSDPHAILARQDVAALVGTTRERVR